MLAIAAVKFQILASTCGILLLFPGSPNSSSICNLISSISLLLRIQFRALGAFCIIKVEKLSLNYRNVPKFSDRQVRANSADPDQTAPDQGLHCLPLSKLFAIPSTSFGHISQW